MTTTTATRSFPTTRAYQPPRPTPGRPVRLQAPATDQPSTGPSAEPSDRAEAPEPTAPPEPDREAHIRALFANFSEEQTEAFVRFCETSKQITEAGRAEGKNQLQINQDIGNVLELAAGLERAKTEGGPLRSPLPGGSYRVSQEEGGQHPGIDLAAPAGTPISAAGAGRVIKAVPNNDGSGYGNYVVIEHPDGTQTLYAHMVGTPAVRVGDSVEAGQNLGAVGTTGHSTGNHLHFEVNRGGQHQNPRDYVPGL